MKRIITVRFDNGDGLLSHKAYAYFTDIEDLSAGDYLIVVVRNIPKIAIVSDLMPSKSDRDKATKWIVSKVDLSEYDKRMEKLDLIREIENELDEELAKITRYETFKRVAGASITMQVLLQKLQDLDPDINLIEDTNPNKEVRGDSD